MIKKLKVIGEKNDFKVNSIFCVGKNYFDHIKEFGTYDIPENPVIFLKPNNALINDGDKVSIPVYNKAQISDELHYESELVVAIGREGSNIPENKAKEYILGFAIGLDMTLRDIQSMSKKKGLPWAVAKGFFTSAPVSDIIPVNKISDPMNLDFEVFVNNVRKQQTNTRYMIFNIYKLISYISTVFTLAEGDLIFTGTPSGVGKVSSGDYISARLSNYINLGINIS